MGTFFIPFHDEAPAAVDIRGHRLLVVTSDLEDLVEHQNLVGADEIREMRVPENDDHALALLAATAGGGVVITPPGVSVSAMLESLETELPWVH